MSTQKSSVLVMLRLGSTPFREDLVFC